MAQVESEELEPNTIVRELQRGYQLRDRLLRPSRVVVSKATDESPPASSDSDEETEVSGEPAR